MLDDFDFQLSKSKRLRGRGWRGLVALALFLLFLAVAIPGAISAAGPTAMQLVRIVRSPLSALGAHRILSLTTGPIRISC
jgi:hypothetical protein